MHYGMHLLEGSTLDGLHVQTAAVYKLVGQVEGTGPSA